MESVASATQDRRSAVTTAQAQQAVITLLRFIGEDISREGLQGTPRRVTKAMLEMTRGMNQDPSELLKVMFTESCDEMVCLTDIPFVSMCEHHLLPFSGVAHVGYLPSNRVVGLSKLARLVDCFARRPQIQERMTQQVANALRDACNPKGVGVIVNAHHSCMSCRGVGKSGATMVTSSMLGAFREGEPRSEFLALCH